MTTTTPPVVGGKSAGVLLNEKTSKTIGIILSVMVAVWFMLLSFGSAGGLLLQSAVLVWSTGVAISFWVHGTYRRGLTSSDRSKILGWPLDLYRRINWKVSPLPAGSGPELFSRSATRLYGIVFTGLVVVWALFYILGGGFTGFLFSWLGLSTYLVGMFVTFWSLRTYHHGLTVVKLITLVFWPIDLAMSLYRVLRRP